MHAIIVLTMVLIVIDYQNLRFKHVQFRNTAHFDVREIAGV